MTGAEPSGSVLNPLTRPPLAGPAAEPPVAAFAGNLVPRALTALFGAASALGLLSIPISFYDDPILLVGARLMAAGKMPYLDFYTHYGPLGYTILAFLGRFASPPALALRIAEILVLAAIAVLLHAFFRGLRANWPYSEYAVAPLMAPFSQMAILSASLGLGLATIFLILFLLARRKRGTRAGILPNAAAGVALAATALIRPAFAVYAAVAVAVLELVTSFSSSAARRACLAAWGALLGAASLTLLLAGAVLYPRISPAVAFAATIVTPARLHGLSDERYITPGFLLSAEAGALGYAKAIAAGAALAAGTFLWAMLLARRRVLRLAFAASAAGGLLPLLLLGSATPARTSTILSLAFFFLAFLVVYAARRELLESVPLHDSAALGLAAAAFGHYFWARPDTPHGVPLAALALLGAALALPVASGLGRAGLLSLGLFLHFSIVHTFFVPATRMNSAALSSSRPWRCTVSPADARDAVAYADSRADPGSRFVAVGSSQAWSFCAPIELFVISSRLPYTRWFQYDPGLQSSPAVQAEMERELEDSGSRTAVVWRAEFYQCAGRPADFSARTPFDDAFDRLYPVTAARFGNYIVRESAPGAPPSRGKGPVPHKAPPAR